MSKKRAALEALIDELAALQRDWQEAWDAELAAKDAATAARLAADEATQRSDLVKERVAKTRDAIGLIAERDGIGDEVIVTLITRAAE